EKKDYYSLEVPVGNFNGEILDKSPKEFIKNSWIVHGPKNHERITFSGENKMVVFNLAKKLLKNHDLNLEF
ncbi:MAG: hypothetical protein LBU40_04885, partial [Methanobrevibacter sp.]|nr:hypothetical protein [Methanobrevibacter sp.]